MEDTDSEDIERDFNKYSKNIETLGFREGIMDGKENLSQGNFDSGYIQGFKMGMALGICNEILSLNGGNDTLSKELKSLILNKDDDLSLKNEEKGHCLVCNKSHSDDTPLKIIEETQKITNEKIISDLKLKYTPILNEMGLNEYEKVFLTCDT